MGELIGVCAGLALAGVGIALLGAALLPWGWRP